MGTPLIKRAYNLGLKAVPNFVEALTEEQVAYYESNLGEIQEALKRGFVLPVKEKQVEVSPPLLFKTADTDFDQWIKKTEAFTKKYLGVKVNLRQMFNIPLELPWSSAVPVFDPGNFTNRDMVNKALKGQGLDVWEEKDVMAYKGSEANQRPTLHLIENSIKPNIDTMGLSPNQLNETSKSFLRLRGYGLALAIRYFVKQDYLDSETWTWFPKDCLPVGCVAFGGWIPAYRRVGFFWFFPAFRIPGFGTRSAIPCSLVP